MLETFHYVYSVRESQSYLHDCSNTNNLVWNVIPLCVCVHESIILNMSSEFMTYYTGLEIYETM